MKKIRIGNDIDITIQVTRNGMTSDLSGKDLKLVLRVGCVEIEVNGFAIEENSIRFTFQGIKQKHLGRYYFTLYEVYGECQNVVDSCDVFMLVPRSTIVGSDCTNVKTESVELSLNVETGGSGGITTDYTALANKPKINDVILQGNKTAKDLGLLTPYDINGYITLLDADKKYQAKGDYATKSYVNNVVGDINTVLDLINGEVI